MKVNECKQEKLSSGDLKSKRKHWESYSECLRETVVTGCISYVMCIHITQTAHALTFKSKQQYHLLKLMAIFDRFQPK